MSLLNFLRWKEPYLVYLMEVGRIHGPPLPGKTDIMNDYKNRLPTRSKLDNVVEKSSLK
jgi:hypothetical protein